jgi:pilus assembly protein CpaE
MIVVADSDRPFRERVAEDLGPRGDLFEIDRVSDLDGCLAANQNGSAVVILGPSLAATTALSIVARLQVGSPEVSVVFVPASFTVNTLQQAIRAGVREVLPSSFTSKQLQKAIEHAEEVSRALGGRGTSELTHEPKPPSHVVTVIGPKGGVGKSFIASNLAAALAARVGEVALVDLGLQFGDLAVMMQLAPARTICDIGNDLERLDEEALRGYLTPHPSGVQLLAAPLEPSACETISVETTLAAVQMLRRMFPVVVVDTPPAFTDHVLGVIDHSDLLIAITTMDVPAIKNLCVSLQTLDVLNVASQRSHLVLNRANSKVGLRIPDLEKTFGRGIDQTIVSSREVPMTINRGTLIVSEEPKSPVSLAINKLAEHVTAMAGVGQPATPHRFHVGRRR